MTRSSEERVEGLKQEDAAGAGNQAADQARNQRRGSAGQLQRLATCDRQAPEACSQLPAAERRNHSAPATDQLQHQQANKPKRNPFCSRCRNHGKTAQVKGHKRHCDYRDCQCEGCKLVECRQIVSARQIKLRRYQKQDEEYGRRIEVSPPVLRREPANDAVTLIANTLIGSSATGVSSAPQFQHQHHHQHQPQPAPKRPRVSAAVEVDSRASSGAQAGKDSQLSFQSCPQPASHRTLQETTSNLLLKAAAAAAADTRHRNHHHQLSGHNQPQKVATSRHAPSSEPLLGGLANPFHLFNLPADSLLASALPGQLCKFPQLVSSGSLVGVPGDAPHCSHNMAAKLYPRPSPPSFQEQMGLVEEIHYTYGLLAVYAWLRAEHFDLQKIRDLIELSKGSFDELLQLTGHSPLDLTSPIVD